MAYRKKTLRRMQPITRRYARIINELDSVMRRLRNLTEDIARLEADSTALYKRNEYESKVRKGVGMKTYRIMNRITKEWWEGEANSSQEACQKAGWMIGDCWVREKTPREGWGKPKEIEN